MKSSLLLLIFFLFSYRPVDALVFFQNTFSGGYYKDIEKKSHGTIFYNWKHNYIHRSGLETFVELGVNNSFVQGEWNIYPYQFFVTFPFDNGFERAPFHNSRVQIGRQLLTEAFELDVLTGIYYHKYWSPDTGVVLFGGGITPPEEAKVKFDDRILGGSLFIRKWGYLVKAGPLLKNRDSEERTLGAASLMKTWEKLPLSPTFLIKERWDIGETSFDQGLGELQLSFFDFYANIAYSSTKPDHMLLTSKNFIYSLFAIDRQKSLSASTTWDPGGNFQINLKAERVNYSSRYKKEKGDIEEISLTWFIGNSRLSPAILRIHSFGGTMMDYGLKYRYNLSKMSEFRLEGSASDIDKINGIEGWAYHARSVIDFHIEPRWRIHFTLEGERNHLFNLNSRMAVYVTHFYY